MMESFIEKDGKKLRRGYTTGACAAAAAKSAALMLFSGEPIASVPLLTPGGIALDLAVRNAEVFETAASCGIVKDSGDDPDVTDGMMICARVCKTDRPHRIEIDGGEGVGRVTKPGLDQPVGAAAINSTPRKMIEQELRALCEENGYGGGLSVILSAPGGEAVAEKTFNPRLGIRGGISILGTTGIVEPMSDAAVIETIRAELSIRKADGKTAVLFAPGNYGADYIKNELRLDPAIAVTTSNFIGDGFAIASEMGFEAALLVGHIGKLVKLAGGMFNTHSRNGDMRAEIFTASAALCGAKADLCRALMDSAVTDDMLALLERAHLRGAVMERICKKIETQIENRRLGGMQAGFITFSKVYGALGRSENAGRILEKIREEY